MVYRRHLPGHLQAAVPGKHRCVQQQGGHPPHRRCALLDVPHLRPPHPERPHRAPRSVLCRHDAGLQRLQDGAVALGAAGRRAGRLLAPHPADDRRAPHRRVEPARAAELQTAGRGCRTIPITTGHTKLRFYSKERCLRDLRRRGVQLRLRERGAQRPRRPQARAGKPPPARLAGAGEAPGGLRDGWPRQLRVPDVRVLLRDGLDVGAPLPLQRPLGRFERLPAGALPPGAQRGGLGEPDAPRPGPMGDQGALLHALLGGCGHRRGHRAHDLLVLAGAALLRHRRPRRRRGRGLGHGLRRVLPRLPGARPRPGARPGAFQLLGAHRAAPGERVGARRLRASPWRRRFLAPPELRAHRCAWVRSTPAPRVPTSVQRSPRLKRSGARTFRGLRRSCRPTAACSVHRLVV
mmetsp:Transcript_111576/g.347800  ORF Transcript_111576/g.347800 Transcript_111576/m.347800 type:complete len:407 (-) Transcript_111576:11-1231(-)